MAEPLPADTAARDRIATDLDTSLLVEAGAGSGKTAAMVGRMVALVRTGRSEVERIAAITFTRKAAGELRERFQEALERAFREAPPASEERARLADARASPDGAFVGTVHAFCARLLRDRPVEAGLPPDFREAAPEEEETLLADGWASFLDHLDARPSRLTAALARVGLRAAELRGALHEVAARPDVRFAAPPAPRPDPARVASVRGALEGLLDASLPHLPAEPPRAGWDALQSKLRALRFSRDTGGWRDETAFHDALALAVLRPNDVVRSRWGAPPESRAAASELSERWTAFGADGGEAHRLTAGWFAHRYRPAVRLARAAAAYCARGRRRAGILTFDDLLVLAASLLRRSGAARHDLGGRWRYLLVDEFQDTDALQAEVVFLLASADPGEGDWRRAPPRRGALFVVGDPRQSIYRFRRADLDLYRAVRERFHRFGAVIHLTTTFRASRAVASFVNRVFAGALAPHERARRPAFEPLVVPPSRGEGGRVHGYTVEAAPGRGRVTGRRVAVPDAARVASWIAARVASGERRPEDFMVIARTRHHLAEYAAALELRGVPVHATGTRDGTGEDARELAALLRALADPGDAVRTLAVLEGPFFGLSHDDLHAHAAEGGIFSAAVEHPLSGPVAAALGEMQRMSRIAVELPAGVAMGAIVDRLGLLPHAAAAELGASRSTALRGALDAVRASSPGSLGEVADRLERAGDDDFPASSHPGVRGAVRVTNLHRAKGLEAPVVVLACPAPSHSPPLARCAVERGEDGVARGHLLVRDGSGRAGAVLARPAEWHRYADAEAAWYEAEAAWYEAEEARLLYVAATRARDELVIGRCTGTAETSVWRAFHAALDDPSLATELRIDAGPATSRPAAAADTPPIGARAGAVAERRREMAKPGWRVEVGATAVARLPHPLTRDSSVGASGTTRTAARGVLAAAASGASDEALRALCRDLCRESSAHGEGDAPSEALFGFVAEVRASAVWRESERAERRLVALPFSIRIPAAEAGTAVPGDHRDTTPSGETAVADVLVEGVVELAYRRQGRWTLVDLALPTDGTEDDGEVALRRLERHARCLERVTGEPVERYARLGEDGRLAGERDRGATYVSRARLDPAVDRADGSYR